MFWSETSSGRTANLHGLESSFEKLAEVVRDSATNVQDDLAKRRTERYLNKSCIRHMTRECKSLRARGVLGSDTMKGLGTFVQNARYMRKSFNVIDNGRLAPESALRWKRRLRRRHAAAAF